MIDGIYKAAQQRRHPVRRDQKLYHCRRPKAPNKNETESSKNVYFVGVIGDFRSFTFLFWGTSGAVAVVPFLVPSTMENPAKSVGIFDTLQTISTNA
eukprot:1893073-Amphidinium_carterae.1